MSRKPYREVERLWELIDDPDAEQLVFIYEAILTEMRTHSSANRLIQEWVTRIDQARDDFVVAKAKAVV